MIEREDRTGEKQDEGGAPVLAEFHAFIGSIAIRGRAGLDAGGRDWARDLASAGHADVAEAWENLGLIAESDSALARGIVDLAAKAGDRLRRVQEPPRSLPVAPSIGPEASPAVREPREVREDEPRRLVLFARVGSLAERRQAAALMADFIVHRKKISKPEEQRIVLEALASCRDPSITMEVTEGLARAGGAEGRRARAETERVDALIGKLAARIHAFWEGVAAEDPLDTIEDADLVTVGIWLRRAPDVVPGHMVEYMEDRLAGRDGSLAGLLSAIVQSGDPRLMPGLAMVVEEGQVEARVAAVKILAHIDDPRSATLIRRALSRADDALERVIAARALLASGDTSATDVVVGGLGGGVPQFVLEESLKAIASMPSVTAEVASRIRALAEDPSPSIAVAAFRALAVQGDAAAIDLLGSVAGTRRALQGPALRAAEEIGARMALAGGEGALVKEPLLPARRRSGVLRRMSARLWYLAGLILLSIGRLAAARRAAAVAALRDPASGSGSFLEARINEAEGRDEAAMECYRRGLQIDPLFPVERWGEANRLLATYLRRAEALEKEPGARDEAISILEETSFIDLSGVDPNLRIEVVRRLDALKLERRRTRRASEPS